VGGTREPHHGVEFYNPSGTPVLASLDGTVFYAGNDLISPFSPWLDFYGNLVILEHVYEGGMIYTLYAHLSEIAVAPGEAIAGGEIIGEVGATGSAIGSHLHFEVRNEPMNYESSTNPELWMIPQEGSGSLSLRVVDGSNHFVPLQLTIQHFSDPSEPSDYAFWPETYFESMPSNSWENAMLGSVPEGLYRITYFWKGSFYERWVNVETMKLTLFYAEVP